MIEISIAIGDARNLCSPRSRRIWNVPRLISAPTNPVRPYLTRTRWFTRRSHQRFQKNSRMPPAPSLACPRSRSRKWIGTSTIRAPVWRRRCRSTIWNAWPRTRTSSTFAARSALARIVLKPEVQSRTPRMPAIDRAKRFPQRDNSRRPACQRGVERTAGDVAAADRHVRSSSPLTPCGGKLRRGITAVGKAGQQPSRIRGVVGEVGVHLHDHVRAEGVQGVDHAQHVCLSESALRTFEEMDTIVRCGELPDQAGGAVRAFVVDDQEHRVRVPVQPGQPSQQRHDVGRFVIRRDDEAHAGSGNVLVQCGGPSVSGR